MQNREQVIEGFRLSPQQKQIWRLQQDGQVYNAQCAILIEGDVDSDALEEALKKIVRRHEILRTTLDWFPGLDTPIQLILENPPLPYRKVDLSVEKTGEFEAVFGDLWKEEARPFDLKGGLLARFCLSRISASRRFLLISLHSLCADGRTLRNLFKEIRRFYAAELEGKELSDEPVQYLQFSEWQNELLEEVNEEIESCENEVSLPVSGLALPLESNPAGRSEASRHRFSIESAGMMLNSRMMERIEEISQTFASSVSEVLLACWQILLWRFNEQKEIVTECLFDGRPFDELHSALGLFAGYVQARGTFGYGLRFSEALERTMMSLQRATASQERSLRDQAGRKTAHRIETIGFEYEEWPAALSAGAARFSYWKQSVCIDRFKLKLGAYRKADGLLVEIQFDPGVYTRGGVELILERYLRLIESAICDSEGLIGELEIVGRRERRRLLVEWNDTNSDACEDRPIHELIGEQARLRPEAIAAVYRQEQLSYLELDGRANQVARELRRLGVGAESVVGLYIERSVEMMIGLLGILKAGGAYLPVEVGQPERRVRGMLEDAGVRVLVTSEEAGKRLPDVGYVKLRLDRDWEEIGRNSREAPEVKVWMENLAYVIYTSGSTGKPKGVMVEHGSVVNLLEGLSREVYEGEGEGLRVSVNAPLVFDASVKQVIQAGRGSRICIVPEDERVDVEKLLEYVREQGIEVFDCTPSQLRVLMEGGLGKGGREPKKVLVGGERIEEEMWEEMCKSEEVRYYNLYGPTECTVDATVSEVREGREATIGRPISNTRVYILDEKGGMRATGVVGEIYIGGRGVGRGYLGEGGMTGERYVPDEYGGRAGERLYRTGDSGKYLEDGRLMYEGRRDDQVKVRGHRIELGEIEGVLRGHPEVREAIVTVREEERGEKKLVGYVVLRKEWERKEEVGGWEGRRREDDEVREEEIKRYVRERLPEYMAPVAVVVMGEFPLTRNGKVDRGGLPRPEEKERNEKEERSEQSAYEEIISGIWKEVLKVERVGRGENFFEMGGHSLLATQVISRMRDMLGVGIGVRSIFEEGTVEGLGRRVEEALRGGEREDAPPLVRAPRVGRLPLSFAQQRLWFLDQLLPNNPLYNCPGALRLEGKLNLEALERAINEIIRRHEVLRTRIEVEEGEPAQVIDEWEPRKLEVTDLSNLEEEEREEEARRIVKEDAGTGFDLRRGPLIRVKALKLEEERHLVVYTMHHIVSDGWSMGILKQEVGEIYQAVNAGEASPLDELPIQYVDFAVWQRAWLKGKALEEKLEYWRNRLEGMEVIELPADHPRQAAPSHRGAMHHFLVDRELTPRLRSLSRREGVTMFMTLLGGFDVLLSRYSGQEEVVVGTDIANRNRLEIEGLIGFFVNQLVMRVSVIETESVRELLKRVREVCLGAYAHQDLPFEKLVEELQPERDLSRSPLFQTKLILQNQPREWLDPKRHGASISGGESQMAKLDLTLIITDDGDDLFGSVEYSRELFEGETIRRLMSHFTNVLAGIAEDCERSLSQLSLLSDVEREQIIVEWNQVESPYPKERCVHQLFADQAKRTPERIALVCERKQFSYREINRRANQLAHYLQGLGVGPEVVVALCLERSAEMIVAVIATLKTGGAYLPLDPEYPLDRFSYILEDAGVGTLLTQKALEERLPAYWGQTVNLDLDWEKIAEQSEGEPISDVAPENLAYVIYTSGSTGRPKGVMLAHKGLCNLAQAQMDAFGLGSQSRVLQFASLSFDASVWEIFSTLVFGGSLHVRPKENLMPGDGLVRALLEDQVTIVTLPPTTLSVLASEELRQLQTVVAAGEACSAEIVDRWAVGRRFIDAYGPTEATVCASMGECVTGSNKQPTIGRPIANMRLYILDREMRPAPGRVREELFISGVGLARGYVGSPELTAERFIPHPFSIEGGERLYRTGDLARYLPNGEIEFIGRTDDQVKIRGYRIELGEIETVLNMHKSTKQSVVVARAGARGEKRLLGYVVGEVGATASELKRHLRERLPEYMLPEAIVILEEMPVTAHGKIDRNKLPLPADARPSVNDSYIAPRDALELKLLKVWESVLGLQHIGVRDNFFDLGGHSLLAASLIGKVRNVVGRELPLSALFQGATVERLSAILRREASSLSWSCLVELQASGSQPPLFFVHPAGGNVVCYLDLTRHLGSDQPIYGLQAPGLYGERSPYNRIEDLAGHYREALRAIQPEGPYFLGGWSSGGIVAYEMAQQMIAQGQTVSRLFLLDTNSWICAGEDIEYDDVTAIVDMFSESMSISKEELRRFQGDEIIDYVLKKAKSENLFPFDLEVAQARSFLEAYKANVRATSSYVPQVYPGAVILFKTMKQLSMSASECVARKEQIAKMIQDPTMGWGELASGGLRIVDIPGRHATILSEPYVETLALRIKACLDDAETIIGRGR